MVQNDGNMKSLKKDEKNRTQRPAVVRRSKNGGEENGGVFGAWKVGNGGERGVFGKAQGVVEVAAELVVVGGDAGRAGACGGLRIFDGVV
ncbi:hypothetical protein TIFTF001_054682 [Ficus carica]|uniref:Uncharacterized protein n=1 Tax=Ficus carica TaxID=3494 RepID=A0AA88EDV0_FICCA|nr:hypothetical protein TIFTF001_054682 [Ficus carica]